MRKIEILKKIIAITLALSLSPLNALCAALPASRVQDQAGTGERQSVISGFLAAKGGKFGLVLKGPELWHTGTPGDPGLGRLDQVSINGLAEILSKTSPAEAEYALAQALSARLDKGAAVSGDGFFSKGSRGRLKITPAGFKALIEKLGDSAGQAVYREVQLDAGNAAAAGAAQNETLDGLRAMAGSADADFGKFFDGSQDRGRAGEAGVRSAGGGPLTGNTVRAGTGLSAAKKIVPALPASGEQAPSWRPPDTLNGRIARIAGVMGSGAGIGAAAFLLWGPAAAAYYLTGSLMKSVAYNADVLKKPFQGIADSGPVRLLGRSKLLRGAYNKVVKPAAEAVRDVGGTRLMLGAGLTMAGMFTGNPVMTGLGLTFAILNMGELLSKAVYLGAYKALGNRQITGLGDKLDAALHKAVGAADKPADGVKPAQGKDETAGARSGAAAKARAAVEKARDFAYNNRGTIAKTLVAGAVSIAALSGFALGTHAVLGNTLGKMTIQSGDLTDLDKAKNTLIGGYRMYNLSGTVLKTGENTRQFYREMKVKYNPVTPEDWAAVIEREITWVAHNDLYGTNLYYITSEEAAKLTTFNNVPGRYSDCTGKAALFYNMLKLEGSGTSEVVLGIAPIGYPDKMGHAWIVTRNATGQPTEIFHYDNTQHLVRSQTFSAAEGIKGDRMAALAGGGFGGLITEGVYGVLEKFGEKMRRN